VCSVDTFPSDPGENDKEYNCITPAQMRPKERGNAWISGMRSAGWVQHACSAAGADVCCMIRKTG
jgi:hypothetical protein